MDKYISRRQQHIVLIVLAAIFLVGVVYYSLFNLYLPMREEHEQTSAQLASERNVLFALQKQLANKDLNETISSGPLQKKVPVIPLEDALLLRIDKAEVKSNSRVQNVKFSKSEFVAEDLPEEVQNLETVLMEVKLVADTYGQVENFIYEIEEMLRIMNVETIQFKGLPEKTEAESDLGEMELVISFNAFFRPDLVNLQSEAPRVDAPAAAGKDDPTTINKMRGDETVE
ncbi:pilus assembly protein PilO [Sporosarcina sp. GW1-11]|uniref:pilus assembly protein PilO n=1 Tax=Sporosarcina sp. GW1-11 TaxID=2899126 RepID=UPI00294EA7AD|nr:pilus assembly protein PilO [Sporosarcina sp. GW1-11]MDV6377226.1 pilus assembly protein PilO [Sporosarcina sp. GW1-11]